MNIDHWLLPLPLNDAQRTDFLYCQEKLRSLLNLPLRIDCLPSDTIWTTNAMEQTTLTLNNRNPLKMYWQRNLNELRLFLKQNRENSNKLDATIIEIHQRRRSPLTRYIKQELIHSSVLLSFAPHTTHHRNHHSLLINITGKHCLLEFQIPSIETELIYRGTYRKIGEDAQSRPVTALFNCTLHLDDEMTLLLSEYGLCREVT